MPEPKKVRNMRLRAETHVMVGAANGGFRVKDAPEKIRARIQRDLKALENMGMVLFVPGVGWVDSMPALVRFQRKMGLDALLGKASAE